MFKKERKLLKDQEEVILVERPIGKIYKLVS